MKGIIVHGRSDCRPIFINISTIKAVEKVDNGLGLAYVEIYLGGVIFTVTEDFDTIMQKIKEAESGGEE